MNSVISLNHITIRNELRPGDIGYIIHRHGKLYSVEYTYGVSFEMYVAEGLIECWKNYDPALDIV